MLLASYLGGLYVAGGKLKATGTAHWESPNTGANNITGFTALHGGMRDAGGGFGAYFNLIGKGAFWWIAKPPVEHTLYSTRLDFNSGKLFHTELWTEGNPGLSVRCLMD